MNAISNSLTPLTPAARPAATPPPASAGQPATSEPVPSQTLADHFAALAHTTSGDPALRQKVAAAITKDLGSTLDGVIQGWRSAHVEKPAFPFVVHKQGRIYAAEAATQLAGNKTRAASLLSNPDISKMMLSDVETALAPSAPPATRDVNDPQFRAFLDAVRQSASRTSNFTCSATLVNVGWGRGDHSNVNSDNCPAGPKTTSAHLANEITSILFEPRRQ